mgnify:CR=1 FL=1
MARIIDGDKMNLIGNNVRKLRKKKKMSQQYLSNQLVGSLCMSRFNFTN